MMRTHATHSESPAMCLLSIEISPLTREQLT